MSYSNQRIAMILKCFGIEFDSFRVEVFTSGNINCTYKVDIRNRRKTDSFVLQRINTFVFKNPVGVMENIDLVTGHIREKLIAEGVNPEGRVLEFLKRPDGTNYYFEDEANFWRCYRYVPNTVTYDQANDPEVLKSAGYSFGLFQKQLCDFPLERLHDVLPDFHNTPVRMERFFRALEENNTGRKYLIAKEAQTLRDNEFIWGQLERDRKAGRLPMRVTHNDTKYNNILIDRDSGEAVCVIDLDTMAAGLCAYDFGDAIRFSANNAMEDEPDLSRVSLNLEMFEAFSAGFVPVCREFCTPAELDSLALGAVTMTFELAARFLEDYLRGDVYFKTTHPEHNLERGRNQFVLAMDMLRNYEKMQEIIHRYL